MHMFSGSSRPVDQDVQIMFRTNETTDVKASSVSGM